MGRARGGRSLSDIAVAACLLLVAATTASVRVGGFPNTTSADFILSGIVYPDSVAIGDLNNDSLNDILVGNSHALRNETGVYYQKSSRSFDPTPSLYLRPGEASSVAIGDLNNDSLNDVAAASWIDTTVAIFYQRANNTLPPTPDVLLPTALRPAHLAVSDLNGDTLTDIAVVNTQSASLYVFFQDANNTFSTTRRQALFTDADPYFVLGEDLNNDGLNDIASANAGSQTVTLYYQSLNHTLPTLPNVTLPITSPGYPIPTPYSLASGDLNGDGLRDLVVGNLNAQNNAVVVFFQQANHTFPGTPDHTISYDRGARSVAVGDLNADGLDDLIAVNTYRFNATVYYQSCSPTLPAAADLTLLTGNSPVAIATGLLNDDSMHDVLISNLYSDNVMIYYQEVPVANPVSDLALDAGDIRFLPVAPVLNGTTVSINATIHNGGSRNACRASVDVYDGDPAAGGRLIGTSARDIPQLENRTVQVDWVAAPEGTHDICVVADPRNVIRESDETNNRACAPYEVLSPLATSLVIGDPNYTADVTYLTSSTPLDFRVTNRSGLGIRNTTYRVDGGDWRNYTATGRFYLAGEGLHTIEWYSVDLAGTAEVPHVRALWVDDTPPATSLSLGEPTFVAAETLVTSSTPITLRAVDGGLTPVGLGETAYRIDGGNWQTYLSSFTLSGSDGPHTIACRSSDLLNNGEAAVIATVLLDNTPPATVISPANGDFTVDTVFNLTATDTGSGVNVTRYRIDDGEWIDYAEGFSLTPGAHTISFLSVDNLGHVEMERSFPVVIRGSAPVSLFAEWWFMAAVGLAALLVVVVLVLVWRRRREPESDGSGGRSAPPPEKR